MISRLFIGLLAGLLVAFSVGCKSKTTVTADSGADVVKAAQRLPEGTNVLAALEQKDYENAVALLGKAREGATDDQGRQNWLALRDHLNEQLLNAMQTDPKAEEAYRGLRVMLNGR